jgi:protein phosphatase
VDPAGAAQPRELRVASLTDLGRVRQNNEDFVQTERVVAADGKAYGLWMVADGVGGGPQGELASRTAVETVAALMAGGRWSDPASALSEVFGRASKAVFDIGNGAVATTMVAVLIAEADGSMTIANVGDSRAYLIADGQAFQVTEDHSIVAARVAAGLITVAEARVAPDRNLITRTIGSDPDAEVDIFNPRPLEPSERLLLCSDGIHGMIEDDVIGRIASASALGAVPAALIAAANEAGGRDNATALIGALVAAPLPISAPDAAGPAPDDTAADLMRPVQPRKWRVGPRR